MHIKYLLRESHCRRVYCLLFMYQVSWESPNLRSPSRSITWPRASSSHLTSSQPRHQPRSAGSLAHNSPSVTASACPQQRCSECSVKCGSRVPECTCHGQICKSGPGLDTGALLALVCTTPGSWPADVSPVLIIMQNNNWQPRYSV